jgi:murein DD-endopeptidase MepM/ murein hydrolase activator NlpD
VRRWFLLFLVTMPAVLGQPGSALAAGTWLVTMPAVLGQPGSALAAGTWTWPVTGPIIRDYDPPDDPYGSGHRGIDIASPVGTAVLAVETGTVTFAGVVGGQLFVTVNHGAGLASTYSWVSALDVEENDVVMRGEVIARSGSGHPGSLEPPHLHLGVKLEDQYVDPLDYLTPLSVAGMIRLAPMPVSP